MKISSALLFSIALLASPAIAGELDNMTNSFCVDVQMDQTATESGYKKEDAKAFLELTLQKNGVKIFDKCANAITVAIFSTKTVIQNTNLPEFYAFAVTFTVGEKAKLIGRKKQKEQVVTTYLQSAAALLKKSELNRLNDEALKPIADAFSNEFLKAAQ